MSLNRRHFLSALAASTLGGCGAADWFGATPPPRLPGTRLSVLVLDQKLEPDPGLANVPVRLPRPFANDAWTVSGGSPSHAMQHLDGADELRVGWRVRAGAGNSSSLRLLASPIVADGKVFVADAEARVAAFDARTGASVWRASARPEDEGGDPAHAGGVAYADGRIYVGTGFAQVLAMDAASGKVLWRQSVPGPVRSAPTVAQSRIIVSTVDNQCTALDTSDGTRQWVHAGIPEVAGLLGGPSPAFDSGAIVVAYSSGEIFALRPENGRVIWQDALVQVRRSDQIAGLSDIRGNPVIDRGLVIAAGNSGRTVGIDLRTGARVWDIDLGSIDMPWVAGDYVFVLSTDSELVCLTRREGRIRWVANLGRWKDEERKRDPLFWSGPVLVKDRLLVVGSHGEMVAVSPYTGQFLGRLSLPSGISLPPIVADRAVYALTDSADLIRLA
ncbi:MAG: pyrrolo-quinoline quinone [Alphaproteobacteria bacterium]|nr:pyrrolo-quinoline quinone [Alphaproteobacteria bacterium]